VIQESLIARMHIGRNFVEFLAPCQYTCCAQCDKVCQWKSGEFAEIGVCAQTTSSNKIAGTPIGFKLRFRMFGVR